MADVFISYSGKSPDAAEQIADELERVGISYWFARRSIEPGQSFPQEIQKAIKNCKVFLLILDKNSNQSEHVLNEINLAFRRKNNHEAIEFLVFKTDNCKVSVDIDYFLNRFQHMDGAPPDAQRVSALIRRIADILGVEISPEKPSELKQEPLKKSNFPSIFLVIVLFLIVVVDTAIWQAWKRDFVSDNSATDNGQESEEENRVEWKLEDGVLTISGEGPIPQNDYVYNSAIGRVHDNVPWWDKKDDIISIVIETGITSIGDNAFESCRNLTSVTIPESVTNIGIEAFYDCDSLTTVTLSEGVSSIGAGAFFECDSLTAVTIPDSVTSIETDAFKQCGRLKSVSVPAHISDEDIENAFETWTKVTRRDSTADKPNDDEAREAAINALMEALFGEENT